MSESTLFSLADERNEFTQLSEFPSYRINRYGDVQSCLGYRGQITKSWHPLLPTKASGKWKYLYVTLRRDGKSIKKKIHDLVLTTFTGPRPPRLFGCHNNGNHQDNYYKNLRWGTAASNTADMYAHGTAPVGERHGNVKLTDDQVREIRRRREAGEKLKALAAYFGVSEPTISTIYRGKKRTRVA